MADTPSPEEEAEEGEARAEAGEEKEGAAEAGEEDVEAEAEAAGCCARCRF